jgi:hypothetical protein
VFGIDDQPTAADNEQATPSMSANDLPTEDLIDIKKKALMSLSPLIGHLDQQPEEKFKTTMMLIQASDNPRLVRQAYEAANQIEDKTARAQALIDIINEINYFTAGGKKS